MCCLKNEQEAYEHLNKITPNVGAYVATPAGKGTVTAVNLLKGIVSVVVDNDGEKISKDYDTSELKIIKNAHVKIDEKELESLKDLED